MQAASTSSSERNFCTILRPMLFQFKILIFFLIMNVAQETDEDALKRQLFGEGTGFEGPLKGEVESGWGDYVCSLRGALGNAVVGGNASKGDARYD